MLLPDQFFSGKSMSMSHASLQSQKSHTHTHATTKHKHTHTADMKSHTASFAGTKASLTVGELISLLALCDEDPLCINCCHRLGRQCAALMSEHLYRYAEHRGSNTSLVEQQKNQTFCMEQWKNKRCLLSSLVSKRHWKMRWSTWGIDAGLQRTFTRTVMWGCPIMPCHVMVCKVLGPSSTFVSLGGLPKCIALSPSNWLWGCPILPGW